MGQIVITGMDVNNDMEWLLGMEVFKNIVENKLIDPTDLLLEIFSKLDGEWKSSTVERLLMVDSFFLSLESALFRS